MDHTKLTKELTKAMHIFSSLSVSFRGLQNVIKFLVIRYISTAAGLSLSPSIALSTFCRTSFSILIRVNQPLIADCSTRAARSRSLLAFLASLAALVDSRKASLLSLFEDIMLVEPKL